MKRRLPLLRIATLFFLSPLLHAQIPELDRVYERSELSGLYGGIPLFYITSNDWEDRYGAGLEIGYRFAPERAPTLRHGPNLETGYYALRSSRSGERADFDLVPLMANYLVAAEVVDFIWVYGGTGGGIGFADIDPKDRSGGSDQTSLWQVFLGIEGAVTEWASLRGGYRHLWVDDMNHDDFRIAGENVSVFEVGVNFWY